MMPARNARRACHWHGKRHTRYKLFRIEMEISLIHVKVTLAEAASLSTLPPRCRRQKSAVTYDKQTG